MVTCMAWYPLNARSININALDCKQNDFLNAMQKPNVQWLRNTWRNKIIFHDDEVITSH